MPVMNLPLNIPGERQTELIEETVADLVKELEGWSDSVYSDGILPGTKTPMAKERLAGYYEMTDPADMELLIDDDYLLRLKHGLDRPPVSPFWLNAVSSQGTFERMRRDFLHLMHQDQRPAIREPRVQRPQNYEAR